MDYVENRMVVDSEWEYMEKEPEYERGLFSRYGTFVKEEYLLEVAMEEVMSDTILKDAFLEKVLVFVESDKTAKDNFLKWFYPDYKEGV